MKVTSATIYWDSQDPTNEGIWAYRIKGEGDREESGEWGANIDEKNGGIEDAVKALVYQYDDDDRTKEIDSGAVACKLGYLLDAIDTLEADGWTISAMNGRLEGMNKMHVYPPGSPSGARIRKWRATL